MSGASLTYRQATVADLLVICELGQQLASLHHRARPDIYVQATPEFERDRAHWLPSVRDKDRATFLAELDDVAVGFVTVQIAEPTSPLFQPWRFCRIGSVGVVEACRGRGIGRALMQRAQCWAIEQGATDMRLTVWTFNEAAIRLYEELGYEARAIEMGKRCTVNPTGNP